MDGIVVDGGLEGIEVDGIELEGTDDGKNVVIDGILDGEIESEGAIDGISVDGLVDGGDVTVPTETGLVDGGDVTVPNEGLAVGATGQYTW